MRKAWTNGQTYTPTIFMFYKINRYRLSTWHLIFRKKLNTKFLYKEIMVNKSITFHSNSDQYLNDKINVQYILKFTAISKPLLNYE